MKNKILNILFSLIFCLFSHHSFAAKMTLSSQDIKSSREMGESFVFNGFGCNGSNLSPQLTINDVPKDTKSLAITMYDPDAPTGSGWWHWIVFDIDPKVTNIERGAKNIGKVSVGKNDYGTTNYGGPCPPAKSRHNYIFTIYALDIDKLPVQKDASAAMIGYYLNKHAISKAYLTPFYRSKKKE